MAKLKNNASGIRVVNAVVEGKVTQVSIRPGETRALDLIETKATAARVSSGEFKVSGSFADAPKDQPAKVDGGDEKAAAQFLGRLHSEMQARDDEIARLQTENEELRKAAEAGSSGKPSDKPKAGEAAFKAEHHGGGKFNVTEGETVHLSGLSKADADAFNAMSAEDQKAYVEAEKAKNA